MRLGALGLLAPNSNKNGILEMKRKGQPCLCAAGLGERNTEDVPCRMRDGIKGRSAIRAIFDGEGRWLVHWREKDGKEWVGTYRLMPC